ncbi:MAG: hypothetical protein IT317_17775 [Anaerolineales bacterium]|nr:hypothetical protein [Anaerolineales bacterium]
MRTPAGFECRYFYANYFRGRSQQECRLVEREAASERWTPGLCRDCPVPKIMAANACPHLVLDAKVVKTWGGLGRKVAASAACTKTLSDVANPHTGCGHCHENLAHLLPPNQP